MLKDSSERVRGTYLGGRDAAVLSGMSPYGSALDVYAAIVKGARPTMNGAMLRGQIVEPGIAQWVIERRKISRARTDAFFVDDAMPFLGGSVDLVEGDPARPEVIHEIKSVRTRSLAKWGMPGTDQVETSALAQSQFYMGLTGARRAHVWCYDLDVDGEPQEYVLHRDDDLIGTLRANCEAFWLGHIVPEVPPIPTSTTAQESVAAVWPKPTVGKTITPSGEFVLAAMAYEAARLREKAAKAEKDDAAGKLKAAIGDAERALWTGGSVSWLATNLAAETDWESVAAELAQHAGISGEAFNACAAKHTNQTRTTRSLRVSLKGKK